MHEQRAARVVHVLARADVHVLQRLGDVEQAPDVHLQTEGSQQPAEDEQIAEKGMPWRCAVTVRRRAGDEADERLAPDGVDVVLGLERHAERGFDDVRVQRVPVERRERRHPVERLGHARHLVQLHRPQLLHERRHLRRRAARTRAARVRCTIASSLSNAGYSIH